MAGVPQHGAETKKGKLGRRSIPAPVGSGPIIKMDSIVSDALTVRVIDSIVSDALAGRVMDSIS